MMRALLSPTDRKLPDKFDGEHCNEVSTLILKMTAYEPSNRPTIDEILEGEFHAYVHKLKEKKRKKKKRVTQLAE